MDAAFTVGAGVSLLLGRGDGTLKTPQTYSTGPDNEAIVTGDFNGDGYPDVAVANYDSGFGHSVSVLLNRANH